MYQRLFDPHNLQFSPNSKTLYFETSAWVTSGAIHAVNVDSNHLRFVTDGSELRVVQSGSYKGNLIVNQRKRSRKYSIEAITLLQDNQTLYSMEEAFHNPPQTCSVERSLII